MPMPKSSIVDKLIARKASKKSDDDESDEYGEGLEAAVSSLMGALKGGDAKKAARAFSDAVKACGG